MLLHKWLTVLLRWWLIFVISMVSIKLVVGFCYISGYYYVSTRSLH